MLSELLTADRIQTAPAADDWKKAIEMAGRPLVADGSIQPEYIDAVIRSVDELGPYIVVDNLLALPHLQSGPGVNQLALSLLVLQQPVNLKGNPVQVFLLLATVEPNTHLGVLAQVAEMWLVPENAEAILSGDKEKILSIFSEY